MSETRKKSETMSFRIETEVLDRLRQEAENQGVSLNVLANKIFLQYAIWGVFEPKVGMIPVAKPIVSALFAKLNENETIDLANKIGKNVVSDIARFMKGTIDMESFVSWFETRMKMSAFEMNHTVKSQEHTYVIKHDLGYNWSLYHKTVLELIFLETLERTVKIDINENMINIVFSF